MVTRSIDDDADRNPALGERQHHVGEDYQAPRILESVDAKAVRHE
jgi:hypothetical protein